MGTSICSTSALSTDSSFTSSPGLFLPEQQTPPVRTSERSRGMTMSFGRSPSRRTARRWRRATERSGSGTRPPTRTGRRSRGMATRSTLMARVNRLCEDCPTLLDAILPHTNRRELAPMEDELDFELVTYYRDHQIAAVIGHIFILSISKVLPSNPLHLTALVADVRFFTRDFPRYIFARSHYLWQGDGIDRSYIYYSCG